MAKKKEDWVIRMLDKITNTLQGAANDAILKHHDEVDDYLDDWEKQYRKGLPKFIHRIGQREGQTE